MITRLYRYLLVQTLLGVAAATAVIASVVLLVDFVETSRDIATRADISALTALHLSLLKAPLLLQETLPFIVLFGVLWTFFRLNRRSELIVMRASGYSGWRILAPAGMLAVLIGLAGSALLNPAGAAGNAQFELMRERILEGRTGETRVGEGPVWLREATPDGFRIITAAGLDAEAASIDRPLFRFYISDHRVRITAL